MQLLTVNIDARESSEFRASGVVVGEEAHIRSGSVAGPRYDPKYPADQVDKYDNLVLLCPTHHTIVDKDLGAGFSIDALVAMKRQHEQSVQQALSGSERQAREVEERTAASIAVWESRIGLSNWIDFTGSLGTAVPQITQENHNRLSEAASWLLAKNWPRRYPRLARAFSQHQLVLGAFTQHVTDNFEQHREDGPVLTLVREYKSIGRWDPPEYAKRFRRFRISCIATWWLAIQLTKSTNLVVSEVVEELDPLYRFDEGAALLAEGDFMGITLRRCEYTSEEYADLPKFPENDVIY